MSLRRKIKRALKKAARAFKKVIEGVVDVVTTIVDAVVETVESIVAWIGSLIGLIVGLVLSIPIIGRIIQWIFQIVKEIIWRIVGIFDFVLALIGILPLKRMSICTIVLRDADGHMATRTEIQQCLDNLITVFKEEANVKVLPSIPFRKGAYSSFSKPELSSENSRGWIHFRDSDSDADILDVDCDAGAAKEDLLLTGSKFELLANTMCFYGNLRRLIGYGAPLVVFIVRRIDGKLGCSLGPLVDYITVSGAGIRRDQSIITHECGHACGLWHQDDNGNLMFPNVGRGTNLKRWQVAILRNSRHVTYF